MILTEKILNQIKQDFNKSCQIWLHIAITKHNLIVVSQEALRSMNIYYLKKMKEQKIKANILLKRNFLNCC